MTKRVRIKLLSMACALAFSPLLLAAPSDQDPGDDVEAQKQARLHAEYKQALAAADRSKAQATVSMERAREQLHEASEQRHRDTERSTELRDRQQAEMAEMREELNRAHRQLRESSREVSQVNRELARARIASKSATLGANVVFATADRPVIGVILGDTNDVGVIVLGVSPDGPAERAGIESGDVIVALAGRVLSAVEETGNVRSGLNVALQDIKAEVPVIVSVERGSETLDIIVVPEVREPLAWPSVVRFRSAPVVPTQPGEIVMIEHIVVPEIDIEGLSKQIEIMKIEIKERGDMLKLREFAPLISEFEFRFNEFSDMGDFVLHDTHAWFGMSLASGLRLASIEPGLGEYFKTDHGVLVLKAKEDNDLLLQVGDVILAVQGTDVNSPADFMRALRNFEPGDEAVIDIKRQRKSKTLKPIIEDRSALFFAPKDSGLHTITITTESD